MIQFHVFPFNPFQENTFVLWNAENECIIIDPGCCNRQEENQLSDFISRNGLKPLAVWLTHCHIDHVLGLDFCLKTWNLPYFLHENEIAALKSVEVYAPAYGFPQFRSPENQGNLLSEGEIHLGNETFQILFVPGHSAGHLAFYHSESGQIWAGDVLFRESIGRTDLPGGNFNQLEKSILEKLYQLPETTVVHPGHGPGTTIGHEKRHNPFVKN
jgi:glyoxylase-like metal-dependent hydrolase (beta-lactamase superfamily II)